MALIDLIRQNRSYRGYDEKRKLTREELSTLVSYARECPSANNAQPLKYYLSYTGATNAVIQPLTAWAAKLRPGKMLPYEGHKPTGFIVICADASIAPDARSTLRDVGIAATAITLGATEMGLGACMIGAFNADNLRRELALDQKLTPMLIIALGKPDETIVLTDCPPGGDTAYYRDSDDVHYVPKRTLDEIIIN